MTIATSVGAWAANAGVGWFAASPADTLAYFSGQGATGQVQLAWVDRKGGRVGTIGAPGNYGQITLSPDERNVALEIPDAEGRYDLWVMDVARGVTSRVTATPGDERDPVWSPDGRSLAFIARRDGAADLRRKGLRASEPETVLTDSPDEEHPGELVPRRADAPLRPADRQGREERLGAAAEGRGQGRARAGRGLSRGRAAAVARRALAGLRLARVRRRTRSTWSPSDGRGTACACPWTAAASRSGGATARSSSSPPRTTGCRPSRCGPPATGSRSSLPVSLFEIRGTPGPGLRRLRAERGWPALPGQAPRRAGAQGAAPRRDELDVAPPVAHPATLPERTGARLSAHPPRRRGR